MKKKIVNGFSSFEDKEIGGVTVEEAGGRMRWRQMIHWRTLKGAAERRRLCVPV